MDSNALAITLDEEDIREKHPVDLSRNVRALDFNCGFQCRPAEVFYDTDAAKAKVD